MISQQEIDAIFTGVTILTILPLGLYYVYRFEKDFYRSVHLKKILPEYLTTFRKWLTPESD
jgi:uncharacterized membrane protein